MIGGLSTPLHSSGLPLAANDADDLSVSSRGLHVFRQSVSELVDVIGEAVERVGGFVGMGTVVGALAGLDHHDVLVEGLAVLAAELDPDGSGVVGAAAAPVHAGSAVLGPVLLQAGAAGVGELHWLTGPLGSATLLSFLQGNKKREIEISFPLRPSSDVFSVSSMLPSHSAMVAQAYLQTGVR